MDDAVEFHAGLTDEAFAPVPDDIRTDLRNGHLEAAGRSLGRPWSIEAPVEHGDARGRTMGFPTANMHLPDGYPLAFGIYAVRVGIPADGAVHSWHDGVANFGIRPMYRITHPLLEAHLFDFDGDLYGRRLRVDFIAYLRPEALFPGLDALIAQIAIDAERARAILVEWQARGSNGRNS